MSRKTAKPTRKRELQLIDPPPSREDEDARRQRVLEGKEIDDSVVIFIIGAKDFQKVPTQGVQSVVLWPDGRVAYVLGDEVHFIMYNYIYVIPQDSEKRKGKQMVRKFKEAKGYAGVHDLMHICGGCTSAEALGFGKEYDIESYKAKYADRVWMPSSREYCEAMKDSKLIKGFSKLL